MSHDLADALKQAVPKPPRTLDPDAIIGLHRQRRQTRRTATTVGALALAAIAIPAALLQTDVGQQELPPAAGGTGQISALQQSEPLPEEWLAQDGFAFLPEEASRVATMSGDGAVYLWADGDLVCTATLFGVSNGGVPGGGVPQGPDDCTPADALLTEGMVTISDTAGEFTGTHRHLVIVVPDGYTDVALGTLSEAVTDNAAVFSWDYLANVDALSRSTDGLVVTGDGSPTVTLPVP